ncbi:MAG: hypothetical protein P9F19_08900 [Candidatus Contendobacter sp.]|nr:hypothetical protein [Candidatus Contendobacter sp.]
MESAANRAAWAHWQEGLSAHFTLLDDLPPLRMPLILDNRAGHKNAVFVGWLMAHGIMPLSTPGGSGLNMAKSMRRIPVSRALSGQHPENPEQIMAWLEAVGRGWNRAPAPFEWGGKRAARRQRAWERRHCLGGAGAIMGLPPSSQPDGWLWRWANQTPH